MSDLNHGLGAVQ